jgi:hypothetical protein
LIEENPAMFRALLPAERVEALWQQLTGRFPGSTSERIEELQQRLAGGSPGGGPDSTATGKPLTRDAQDALAAAEKFAGCGEVQPAHLLAGLAGVTPALAEFGITPERVTAAFP